MGRDLYYKAKILFRIYSQVIQFIMDFHMMSFVIEFFVVEFNLSVFFL